MKPERVMDWMAIGSAPFDLDLELAVIDRDGRHALAFPCRRDDDGWRKAATGELVEVHPSHWREWQVSATAPGSVAPARA